jgi:LPXTG-site transpeptidase (sortase) family protein
MKGMGFQKSNGSLSIGRGGRARSTKRGFWRQNWVKIALFLVVFAGALVGGWFLFKHFAPPEVQQKIASLSRTQQLQLETSQPDKDNYTVPAAYPRYLHIPEIDVDQARILGLGVLKPDKDGGQQLDSPKNIYDTGWYNCTINPVAANKCATPTLPGGGDTNQAAVIDGHTCDDGEKCVFNNLSKLKKGDTVTVERGDGSKLNYTVDLVEIKKLADVDMSKVMRPIESGTEGLNLITCIGQWTATDSHGVPTMDERVIVYTTLQK